MDWKKQLATRVGTLATGLLVSSGVAHSLAEQLVTALVAAALIGFDLWADRKISVKQ